MDRTVYLYFMMMIIRIIIIFLNMFYIQWFGNLFLDLLNVK